MGEYKAEIDNKSYSDIINLLNYIDFQNLNDEYAVNWTDDQTSYITITYDQGKIKTIRDYGLIGTHGLDKLYDLLFKLRFNQNGLAFHLKIQSQTLKKTLAYKRLSDS